MPRRKIYYSPRDTRFYDEHASGIVSTRIAVQNLEADETGAIIDSRGRTIDVELLRPATITRDIYTQSDALGRTFVSAETRSRLIAEEDVTSVALRGNQDVVARIVVKTDDGRVHVFERGSGLDKEVDLDQLKDGVRGVARKGLQDTESASGKKYKVTTNDIKKGTIRLDFYVRTIKR